MKASNIGLWGPEHASDPVDTSALAPYLILAGLVAVVMPFAMSPGAITLFAAEDGPIENLTAIFYFLGMFGAVFAMRNREIRILAVLWFFLCLVFLGEEVSWFQRVLDYSVASVEATSYQGEFNLHNQMMFSVRDGGPALEVMIKKLLYPQNLFRLGFVTYFIVLPVLASRWPAARGWLQRVGYRPPPVPFTVAVLLVLLISFACTAYAAGTGSESRRMFTETRECLYAYFIAVYVFEYLLVAPLRARRAAGEAPARRDGIGMPDNAALAGGGARR